MSVLPTCPKRVLYQQESGLKSLISPAPCQALHFSAVSSCGFTAVAQTDVEQAEGGDSFSCSVQRLRNNHPKHSRVLAEFTSRVIRGIDGFFYARGVLTLVTEQGSTCLLQYLPLSLLWCLLRQLGCRVAVMGVQNVTNCVAVGGFCKGSDGAATMVLLCSPVQLLCPG